jgi:hypothetical protein
MLAFDRLGEVSEVTSYFEYARSAGWQSGAVEFRCRPSAGHAGISAATSPIFPEHGRDFLLPFIQSALHAYIIPIHDLLCPTGPSPSLTTPTTGHDLVHDIPPILTPKP